MDIFFVDHENKNPSKPMNRSILHFNYLGASIFTTSVCVCVCVCVFISFHRNCFWLNKNKCNAWVQVSDGMLRKYLCIKYLLIKYFCRHVIGNHRRNLQGGNCAKECQLSRAKPREVKDNSYKLSKNQR